MKKLYTIIVLSSLFLQSNAQHVEWKDVAPIVYRECTSCHREGEIGEDYIDATGYSAFINSPYFYSIPYYVNTKLMPPYRNTPQKLRRAIPPPKVTTCCAYKPAGSAMKAAITYSLAAVSPTTIFTTHYLLFKKACNWMC